MAIILTAQWGVKENAPSAQSFVHVVACLSPAR
jgi:hypothetical protein